MILDFHNKCIQTVLNIKLNLFGKSMYKKVTTHLNDYSFVDDFKLRYKSILWITDLYKLLVYQKGLPQFLVLKNSNELITIEVIAPTLLWCLPNKHQRIKGGNCAR